MLDDDLLLLPDVPAPPLWGVLCWILDDLLLLLPLPDEELLRLLLRRLRTAAAESTGEGEDSDSSSSSTSPIIDILEEKINFYLY